LNDTGDLAAFRAQVTELNDAESTQIRHSFVESFINQDHPRFAEGIKSMRRFRDGLAYTHYLWDFLKSPTIIDEDDLWQRILGFDQLLVMWDIHSAELIRIPDYWKFPNATVLSCSSDVAFQGRRFLPEDLYLFDDSYRWVGVSTHEIVEDRRYCLWQGTREKADLGT
jgi:hypothetical protein